MNSTLRNPPASSLAFLALLVTFGWQVAVEAGDWNYCRGPHFDGVSLETGLIDDWDPNGGAGSNVAWVREEFGGRSTPVTMAGRLYTICRSEPGTPREGERVVCLDATTGDLIWENRFNVYSSDVPDTRVGWSSCVADPASGNIYALGVCGLFLCIDAETGETRWSVPMHERLGLLSTYGGRTNFPIVFEDLVIISAIVIGWGDSAKPNHRFIAFDKQTGELVWINGTRDLPDDTTYSAPILTTVDGQAALIVGCGDGAIWAFQPRTGREIWHFDLSLRGLNVPAVVAGDKVIVCHSEENVAGTAMGAVVAIQRSGEGDVTGSAEIWRQDELMVGKAAPLIVDGRVYLFDDRAKLHVLDLETGQPVGSRLALGTMMRSSPLYADGKIYAFESNGRWYILQPDERRGVKKLMSGRLLDGDECHASPICSNGRVYVQTTGRLYCLADPNKAPTDPDPDTHEAIIESDLSADQQAAHLQIVPGDSLVRPGATIPMKARLFNAHGQFLRDTSAEFFLSSGKMLNGKFKAPGENQHVAVNISATAEGASGNATVRVVPDLPWKFDFEQVKLAPNGIGEPPITWIGIRYRHQVREVDGSRVLVKITTIPKGTRSQGWLGHSDLHDYTIQADVRGAISDAKMPDIGIVAQGYTLDLQGLNQRLQIRSWVPTLRMANTIDFPWSPDTWYTMKLQAENQEGRTVVRGKVWPRGEVEPSDWTLQAEDTFPIRTGSPGLYGNAKDAEIYLDNLSVTPNNPSSN